jgi:hypothetical protein
MIAPDTTIPELGTIEQLKYDSLSLTKERCDDARAAATVKYTKDEKRLLIRSIDDQKVADGMKTKLLRAQLGALMAQLREGYQGSNRFMDFVNNTVSCGGTIGSDVFPISARSVRASGWRTNPLMNGGGLGSFGAAA